MLPLVHGKKKSYQIFVDFTSSFLHTIFLATTAKTFFTMAALGLALLASLAVTTLANDRMRVCYYSNWSQYRPGTGKFLPSDIDPFLCTHLIYSFAKLDYKSELTFFEWNDDKLYAQFNGLKSKNPNLKTLLATGGWNAGSKVYSDMVTDVTLREKFARTSVQFVRKWGFDGLDMDWEYPALRGGRPEDKQNFIELLKDLEKEIDKDQSQNPGKSRLLLTAAVAAGKSNVDAAYNIPEMAKYLDFINLMSYDLNGAWNDYTGFNSPLYARSSENGDQKTLNVDWAAKYWVQQGTPKEKLIIGLATYGRHFRLSNPSNFQVGAPAADGGTAGLYTREKGFLAYYEICDMLSKGAKRYWEPEQMVPYLVSGDQWVGYDDEESIEIKLMYIKEKGYGGAMVWNIDLDDFNKQCSLSKRPYPLMSLMAEVLGGYTPPSTERPTKGSTITTQGPTKGTDRTETPIVTGSTKPPGEFSCNGRPDGFYPDPTDCSAYYQCWSGIKYRTVCGNDLLWNQAGKYCDFHYNVDCQLVTSTTEAPTNPPTTQEPTNPPTNPPTDPPTEQPTNPPATEKPADFCKNKANGLYKKKDDCQSYYNCAHGLTNVYTCADGTLFNAATKNCDWARNVDCDEEGDKTDPVTTNCNEFLEFCANKADGMYTYPEDCRKYYHCGSYMTYVKSCSAGLYWNPSINNCDWAANVDCGARPVPPAYISLGNECADLDDGLYPDQRNCHGFFRCENGGKHPGSCGKFLRFNPSIGVCDWPMNVKCFKGFKRGQKCYKRVCYYANWAQYRPVPARMMPDKIDPNLCTHLIYAFAKLDSNSELSFTEFNDGDMVKEFNNLKKKNPELRTLLAIGGYNQGSKPMSVMTANRNLRKKFARTAVDFIKKWGFNGLDLDWEFPTGIGKERGKKVDKQNFISLLKDLRQEFAKEDARFLLTAAVSAEKSQIDKSYDIPGMVAYLDFINLMSYDLHGDWEKTAEHNSPLHPRPDEMGIDRRKNVEWAARYWVQQGTPKELLIIGLPTYGRHYKLKKKNINDVGSPIKKAGEKGPYTKEYGFMAFYEVCELMDSGEIVVETDQEVPHLLHEDHWIGYDDEKSFTKKLEFIKAEGYGGAMVWSLDLDDFDNLCPYSYSNRRSYPERRFPLVSLMAEKLGEYIPDYMPEDYYIETTTTAADDWNQDSDEDWNQDSEEQNNMEYKTVCYFTNWAQYRPGPGKYLPRDIDPNLCTHLIYSFAKLENNELALTEWNDEDLYAEFNGLKSQNPNLKTLVATGGWNAGSKVYSDMVSDEYKRKQFAKSSVEFLRGYGFDGLDLDWEYPALRGGKPEDRENFIELLKDLSNEFDRDATESYQPRLLLTAAVAAGKSNIDPAYDIPQMARYLDFINLMSYDLHGHWDETVGHNSPLYARHDEMGDQRQLNTDWAARYWVEKGTPPEKLIIGLALYGRNYELADRNQNDFGAKINGPGDKGEFTGQPGFLAYYEVCQILKDGATREWNGEHRVPYLVDGNQWIGYDDEKSFSHKLKYIKDHGFGGAMVWAIDLDDFNGQCSEKYPLMKRIQSELSKPGNSQSWNDNQDDYNQHPAAQTQWPPADARPTQPQTAAPTQRPPQTVAPTQRPPQTAAPTQRPPQTAAPPSATSPEEMCKIKPTGYMYGDPSNCAKFVTCLHGSPVIRPCAPGTHWNQQIKNCDFPWRANCQTKRTLKAASDPERSALETLLRKLDMKLSGLDSRNSNSEYSDFKDLDTDSTDPDLDIRDIETDTDDSDSDEEYIF
ncbi:probable chitinase 10 [Mercenaria mercenaria]|uniref:probable chitinase 10 n=1 Tax=Mercenaria mercenaria TaxID=6596 RepID=UPI00234E8EBC|nr:probable chitinase 10 [Mercenaria mercenaria]